MFDLDMSAKGGGGEMDPEELDGASPMVLALLARADGELVAAELCGQPWERLLHAHLAAVRSAAAVLAWRGHPRGRGLPRDVWGLADLVAPELSWYWAYFRSEARIRSGIEAGRVDQVRIQQGDAALNRAEAVVDAVRALIGSRNVGSMAS